MSTTERMLADLLGSDLTPEDLGARLIENPERATTGLPAGVTGYAIPYRDFEGKALPFYRVRTFDFKPKYKQGRGQGNFIYFPRGFKKLALEKQYLIITEGEKKAACAVKNTFPAIALTGVDSWHNNTFTLPEGAELGTNKLSDKVVVKITAGDQIQEGGESLAVGMNDLIDFIVKNKLTVIICYDTDKEGVKFDVQRASATLGYELRYRGVELTKIRQLIIPPSKNGLIKVGIDDYIVHYGTNKFEELIKETLTKGYAFPRHPNPRDYINKRLQRTKLSRKEAQQTSIALLCELDTGGSRIRSKGNDALYYFHTGSKRLLPASLLRRSSDALVDTLFSRFLYQEYGVNHSDMRVLSWLTTQFTSEQPIRTGSPSRVMALHGNDICYQINDGQYIHISGSNPDGLWTIRDNGSNGILFEAGKTEPIDAQELLQELNNQRAKPFRPWWVDVFNDVRLKRKDQMTCLAPLLFYMSPWLYRWKGSQIPLEMVLGEAGTGKSSLYSLRLQILTGNTSLRNAPDDIRDWHASISSMGGLHVTDNVQFVDKALKQRLSDEICRLITEPNPHIEMRKLYTEADNVRIPVQSVFALTAIKQPFQNSDLIQRSFIIELEKHDQEYDSSWPDYQLRRFGGRIAWIAHEIIAIQKFLQLAHNRWDSSYKAKHRLVNLEQNFMLMAEALGIQTTNIGEYLSTVTAQAVTGADWVMEGLSVFAKQRRQSGLAKPFGTKEISSWAAGNEEFCQCTIITSSRSLGRYIADHKSMVAAVTGIVELGQRNNLTLFGLIDVKEKK